MYCQHCGHEVNDDAKICLSCGCPTDNYQTTVPTATTTTQYKENQSAVAGATATKTDYSPKKGVVTLALLLAMGQFGVHRFYAGRTGSAIGMLALFVTGIVLFFIAPFFEIALHELNIFDTDYPIEENTIQKGIRGLLFLVWSIWWIAWWIIDLISLCSGKFRDGNGRVIKLS